MDWTGCLCGCSRRRCRCPFDQSQRLLTRQSPATAYRQWDLRAACYVVVTSAQTMLVHVRSAYRWSCICPGISWTERPRSGTYCSGSDHWFSCMPRTCRMYRTGNGSFRHQRSPAWSQQQTPSTKYGECHSQKAHELLIVSTSMRGYLCRSRYGILLCSCSNCCER